MAKKYVSNSTKQRILITGSEGLIGSALSRTLSSYCDIIPFDIRLDESQDIRSYSSLVSAVQNCTGIVHLAAVSRVIWAQQDPELCWETNVRGTHNVVGAALRKECPPWIIFASSREVYGQPMQLPVTEECPLRPVNIYGKSKKEGERVITDSQSDGIKTAIVRFSNVYGSVNDHSDRVVPAFIYNALQDKPLMVEGCKNAFDFTHVKDVVNGLFRVIELLDKGRHLPPIHFVTGVPTNLGLLAKLVVRIAGSGSVINYDKPRTYDVSRFYGDPTSARELIGWQATIGTQDGIRLLCEDFSSVVGHPSRGAKLASERTKLQNNWGANEHVVR